MVRRIGTSSLSWYAPGCILKTCCHCSAPPGAGPPEPLPRLQRGVRDPAPHSAPPEVNHLQELTGRIHGHNHLGPGRRGILIPAPAGSVGSHRNRTHSNPPAGVEAKSRSLHIDRAPGRSSAASSRPSGIRIPDSGWWIARSWGQLLQRLTQSARPATCSSFMSSTAISQEGQARR